MQVNDVAGLGIHLRADAVGVATCFVPLSLEFEDPPVKAVGIPLPYYDQVLHEQPRVYQTPARRGSADRFQSGWGARTANRSPLSVTWVSDRHAR